MEPSVPSRLSETARYRLMLAGILFGEEQSSFENDLKGCGIFIRPTSFGGTVRSFICHTVSYNHPGIINIFTAARIYTRRHIIRCVKKSEFWMLPWCGGIHARKLHAHCASRSLLQSTGSTAVLRVAQQAFYDDI